MDGWKDGRKDGWMDRWEDGWMDGRMRIRINMRIEELEDEEGHMGANRHDFGGKSSPGGQIGKPVHLASTCVHHNIGNELTVEVN